MLQSGLLKSSLGLLPVFGKVNVHPSFGKNKVDDKGVTVPIRMDMAISMIDPMSDNSESNFSGK